jgi:hypothetical protein
VSLLERIRSLIWRAEEASNELEYTALDAVHQAEDAVDEHTGGRFYDALEKTEAEAEEALEKLRPDETDDDRSAL